MHTENPSTGTQPATLRKLAREDEIADMLGVSRQHLTHLRERRLIPFVKLGRVVRFDVAAVSAAIDRLTVQTKGECP